MGQERTHYDRVFKENAVKLSYERKNVSELARELGIASHLIYRWRKEFQKYGQGSFPGNGILKLTPEEKELADLKEKMRKLELENEILKKQCTSFQETIGKFGQIPIQKRERTLLSGGLDVPTITSLKK